MEPHPPAHPSPPSRPADRRAFEIAIICALILEADAADALFDRRWDDDGPFYDKAPGDPNAYSTGAIGRHNVVLAHMSGKGKASAAAVAAHCLSSFPNIRLALLVGICGGVPFGPDGREIVLGDVVISDGVVQYDFGKKLPTHFLSKDTLLRFEGRPEIRAILTKLRGLRGRKTMLEKIARYLDALREEPELAATYPGAAQDRLFEASYVHEIQDSPCEQIGCNGALVSRNRLASTGTDLRPAVHFGRIASADTVMKSGEDRDKIARAEQVIAFEMESAATWDIVPCVVIKGVCDYADSHKNDTWQRYAAAAAAAAAKAFLDYWVPRQHEQTNACSNVPGPWFIVPYQKNGSFVGRVEMLEKLKSLAADGERAALYGLGGIGKTQVALEYAYWVRENNPGTSVFWIHASNTERFSQSMLSIAQQCKIPGYEDPKANAAQLVKTWLERTDQRPWLMVIDNADDIDLLFSSPDNISLWFPSSPQGAIILTTRNKQVGVRFAETNRRNVIKVGEMNENEAGKLLRDKIEDDLNENDTSALSARLESIPLALVQASAYIQENSLSVSRYLKLLDDSDKQMVDMLSECFEPGGRDSDTPHAVAATWILSFEQIAKQLPLAAHILSVMSHYDRQNIPIIFAFEIARILHKRRDSASSDESLNSKQMPDSKRVEDALGKLKAYSFVVEGMDEKLSMHRLVQLVTRKWLADNGRYEEFAAHALVSVSENFPSGKYETWTICADYLPHALSVLRFRCNLSNPDSICKGSLLQCLANYMSYQGQWKAAEGYEKEAMAIRQRILGAEHPDTLSSMANLASTFWNQGQWKEAEDLELVVMETLKRVLGAEHPNTLTSMANLASTFRNQGRWKEAEDLELVVMETRKRVLGAKHPDTLTSMANLASTFRNQGRWKEAENLNLVVMETRKRVLGAEHPDTLTSMANLASTFRNQGRWKEAEDLGLVVMETRKRVLGAEHPDTLINMNNVAFTWYSLGRTKEAISLMEKCVRGRIIRLGSGHHLTISSQSTLKKWYTKHSGMDHGPDS